MYNGVYITFKYKYTIISKQINHFSMKKMSISVSKIIKKVIKKICQSRI